MLGAALGAATRGYACSALQLQFEPRCVDVLSICYSPQQIAGMRLRQAMCGDAATPLDRCNVAIRSHPCTSTCLHNLARRRTAWCCGAQPTAPCCWQLNEFISASCARSGGARAGVLHHSASCLSASGHGACNKYIVNDSSDRTGCTAQANMERHTPPRSLDVCVIPPFLARPLTLSIAITDCCQLPAGRASTPGWQAPHTTHPSKTPSWPATGAGLKTKLLQPVLGQLNDQGIQTTAARSHPNCPNRGCSCSWTLQLPWPARSAAAADLMARLTRTPPACCLLKNTAKSDE